MIDSKKVKLNSMYWGFKVDIIVIQRINIFFSFFSSIDFRSEVYFPKGIQHLLKVNSFYLMWENIITRFEF